MTVATEKKKARGSVVIMAERCKGCGFCVEFCPPKALKLSEQYNRQGYHPPVLISEELCNGCNICGLMCPDFAIYGFIYMKKKSSRQTSIVDSDEFCQTNPSGGEGES